MLTSLGVGFVLTPLIIHELGTSQYGLWLLIFAIVSYFQLFDLGFTRAVMHEVAVRIGDSTEHITRERTSSFLALFAFLGLAIMATTVLLAVVLPSLFEIEEGQKRTARAVLLLIGGAWALQFPATYMVGLLQGYERFDVVNGTDSLSRLFGGISSIVVVSLGGGLLGMTLALITFDLMKTAIRIVFARRALQGFRFSLRDVSFSHIRSSFSRSVSYFSSATRGIINLRADPLIIGAFLSLTSVGVYGVALRLVQLARTLSTPFSDAMTPSVSRIVNRPDSGPELRRIMVSSARIGVGIMAGISMMVLVFGREFLDLWIGAEVEEAYEPLVILSIASLLLLAQDMSGRVLMASDLHRVNGGLNVLNIVVNISLSLALIGPMGLVGVATGTLVASAVVAVATIYLACRLTNTSTLGFVASAHVPALLPALPAGLLGYGLRLTVPVDGWLMLVFQGGLVMSVFGVAFMLLNPSIRVRSYNLAVAARKFLGPKRQQVAGGIK